MEKDNTEILLCNCEKPEHQIIIYKDKNFYGGRREIIFTPHFYTHKNIFKRIIVAIKYIIGYKTKYGAWDSIIIDKNNYKPLKNAINFLENK